MTWAVIGGLLVVLLLTVILVKESVTHSFWRTQAGEGDVTMVALLLQQEMQRWRTMRVPKGTPPALWHGVQTVDLFAVGPRDAHLTCSAEGEYRFVNGRSEEVTSPIDAAMRVAAKLCELVLYDIPNLRVSGVRVDVYSTFRETSGAPVQRCILTTTAERSVADSLVWESLRPQEVIARLESRYDVDAAGIARPIAPGPLLEGTVPAAEVPLPPEPEERAGAAPVESDKL
jgi:hypothetical protein